jgi:membrane protein required for colicin V production
MNFLDIILIIPIIWLAYKGFKKGLIIELTSLLALILGVYMSYYFSDYTADFLRDMFNVGEKYMSIISFALTFIVVVMAVFAIGKMLEKFVDIIMLGFINKIAGSFFGILKAVFVLSVIIYIINGIDHSGNIISNKLRDNSLLYNPISSVAEIILPKLDFDKIKDSIPGKDEVLDNI